MEQERKVGKEHPHSHLLQFFSVVAFFLVWGLDSFIFQFSTILSQVVPLIIRIILFFVIVGVGIILLLRGGHKVFHEEHSGSNLVTTDVFAHVRHPLYLGVQLFYFACILLTMSLLALVAWIPIFIVYDKLATYEEEDLIRSYENEYLEYKKKVPKWIPR